MLFDLVEHRCQAQYYGGLDFHVDVKKIAAISDSLLASLRELLGQNSILREPVVCINRWHGNYYHFLVETLPALILFMKKHPGQLHSDRPCLVVDQMSDYWVGALDLLGYRGKIVENIEKTCIVQNPHLVLPSRIAEPPHGFDHLKEVVKALRFEFSELIDRGATMELPKRFFIERRPLFQGSNRVLCPQDQLHQDLMLHGYEIVYMEDLSLSQQIMLFAGAEKILAVHGAALSNVMFCSPDCEIVEFMLETLPIPSHFQKIASATGISKYFLECLPCALSTQEQQRYFKIHDVEPNDLRLPLRYTTDVAAYF